MAALSCACGKLLSCAGKLPYISKYVVSMGCIVINYRSPSWRNNFHTTSETETRPRRDRMTVLKALSSTVERIPNRLDHRFFDDTVLKPRIEMRKREYKLALDSGEKAAEYVLEKYPHLFPLRNPEPAWPQKEKISLIDDMEYYSVENLRFLMKDGENILKVVDCYKTLDSKGDVSLDVHNDMLDFASFYAISGENETIENKWSKNMFAEKLFADLKDKGDARTYEVFILGLLKHKEIFKALKVYQEFTEKNIPGSLYMYNTLLSHVCEIAETIEQRWILVQDIANDMKKNNINPNISTFISLMDIASASKNPRLCQQLLKEMKKLEIVPSLGCYYYFLSAETRISHKIVITFLALEEMKNGMVQYEIHHPSDLKFFYTAMGNARFWGHVDLAKALLDMIIDNRLNHVLGKQMAVFFGNYICTIAKMQTDLDHLFEEYRKLVPKYFTPQAWIYEQIFYAMYHNKDPKHVPTIYSNMVAMRVGFREKGAMALFAAMAANIPKEKAAEYLYVVKDAEKWMSVFGIAKTEATLSVEINVLCLCEKYEDVLETLVECDNLKIVPTTDAMVSILELTINNGNNDGALNTLKTMAKYKMTLTNKIKEMIFKNDYLHEKYEVIKLWF